MIPGLTSFRALAFLAVFLFHAGLFDAGYLGVQAFFVLSGFLITPILSEMKSRLAPREYFLGFYGRRTLRIFPIYYLYLGAVALLATWAYFSTGNRGMGQLGIFLDRLPWAATYSYNFFHAGESSPHSMLVVHFWSLAVEEQFYLVWPLAIFFVPQRRMKGFLLAVILAGPLIRLATAWLHQGGLPPLLGEGPARAVYVLPFSHLDAFAAGGWGALQAGSRKGWAVAVGFLAVAALGLSTHWLATGEIYWKDLGYGPFMGEAYKYAWGYSLLNALFAAALVHIRDGRILPRLLESRPLVYLGTISYGMYVYHYAVLWVLVERCGGLTPAVRAAAAFLITVVISAASFELIERRLIARKDRWFRYR